MKTDAGPSAPARSPSSTSTSKVSLSPSSFGDFSTTTASRTDDPSFLNPETVAFGGSFAKLSLPLPQSSTIRAVRSCPAARTGRSANTMAFGDTPARTSFPSFRTAPLELRTNNEGTTSGFACPMDFSSGICGFGSAAIERKGPSAYTPYRRRQWREVRYRVSSLVHLFCFLYQRCWHAMSTGKWFCPCNLTAAGQDVLPFHANRRVGSRQKWRASFALSQRCGVDANVFPSMPLKRYLFPFGGFAMLFPLWRGRHPRQSQRLVPVDRMRPLLWSGLVNSLNSSLPSIDDRLYFCPTHEDAAEAARSRIAEAQGDLRYALAGLKKQVARRIEAHFRNHVSVAGAHCSEMTLQRARAHPQLDCGAFKCCATVAQ